jgi:hypothetical protein
MLEFPGAAFLGCTTSLMRAGTLSIKLGMPCPSTRVHPCLPPYGLTEVLIVPQMLKQRGAFGTRLIETSILSELSYVSPHLEETTQDSASANGGSYDPEIRPTRLAPRAWGAALPSHPQLSGGGPGTLPSHI